MKNHLNYSRLAASTVLIVILAIASIPSAPLILLPQAEAQAKLFELNMMVPNYSPVRRQWAQIIAESVRQVGIDAKVVYVPLIDMNNHWIQAKPEYWDKGFADGGFEAYFCGVEKFPFFNPRAWFHSDPATFAGWNLWRYQNKQLDPILEEFERTVDDKRRTEILHQVQRVVYEDRPYIGLMYGTEIQVVNPKVQNFQEPAWSMAGNPEFLTGKSKVTMAVTGYIPYALHPGKQASIMDMGFTWAMFEELAELKYDGKSYEPRLATSWKSSTDLKTWTVTLRQGVKWHTGVEMTADDVVFSALLWTDAKVGSYEFGYWAGQLGENPTLTYADGTVVRPKPASPSTAGAVKALDKYTVQYTFVSPNGIFFPEGLGNQYGLVLPKHVLEPVYKEGPEKVMLHSFSTGTGTYTIKLPDGSTVSWRGPVGTGPYKFVDYDATRKLVKTAKFPGYWNRASLEAQGLFGVEEWSVVNIPEKEPAIAALKAGEVDILDYNYKLQKEYTAGVFDNAWSKTITFVPFVMQELGFNMWHPLVGTGKETPLGKRDPARAAEGARYIRQAIDHLIPRKQIIDALLGGVGAPAGSNLTPSQLGYLELPVREYNPDKARELLAKAGYTVPGKPGLEVGLGTKIETVAIKPTAVEATRVAAPPVGGIESISIPAGEELKMPSFLLGMSAAISGSFVDTVTGKPYPQSMVVILQESTDKSKWTNVAVVNTDAAGKYSATVTPTKTGKAYYRAFFPGITTAVWGPSVVDPYLSRESMLAQYGVVAPPITSAEIVELEVSSLSTGFAWVGKLAQVNQIKALGDGTTQAVNKLAQTTSGAISDLARSTTGSIDNLAKSTTSSIDKLAKDTTASVDKLASDVSTKLSAADTQAKSTQNDVKALQSELRALRSELANVSMGMYAAIVLAVVLSAAAIMMSRRKPTA